MPPANANDFKTADAHSYDEFALRFDALSQRFTTPLAQRMIALAGVSGGARVLDIATGSGVVALLAAAKVGATGRVVGIDLSEGMLAAARQNAARAPALRAEFLAMDAEQLQFGDASFDSVLSLFALHHFPNPAVALAEMLRVLRPGGTLCVGVGSGPNRLTRAGIADGITQARDLVQRTRGRLLRAPHFIEQLVAEQLPPARQDELTELAATGWKRSATVPALVRAAGFANIRTEWVGHRAVISDAEQFWELQRIYSSTARKRLATLSPAELQTFKGAFLQRCEEVLRRQGQLIYSYAALFVAGQRPTR